MRKIREQVIADSEEFRQYITDIYIEQLGEFLKYPYHRNVDNLKYAISALIEMTFVEGQKLNFDYKTLEKVINEIFEDVIIKLMLPIDIKKIKDLIRKIKIVKMQKIGASDLTQGMSINEQENVDKKNLRIDELVINKMKQVLKKLNDTKEKINQKEKISILSSLAYYLAYSFKMNLGKVTDYMYKLANNLHNVTNTDIQLSIVNAVNAYTDVLTSNSAQMIAEQEEKPQKLTAVKSEQEKSNFEKLIQSALDVVFAGKRPKIRENWLPVYKEIAISLLRGYNYDSEKAFNILKVLSTAHKHNFTDDEIKEEVKEAYDWIMTNNPEEIPTWGQVKYPMDDLHSFERWLIYKLSKYGMTQFFGSIESIRKIYKLNREGEKTLPFTNKVWAQVENDVGVIKWMKVNRRWTFDDAGTAFDDFGNVVPKQKIVQKWKLKFNKETNQMEPTVRYRWLQELVPPERVIVKLVMPDDKVQNFIRFIDHHLAHPEEGDPEIDIDKEKEKIERFKKNMQKIEQRDRSKYLFNFLVYAFGYKKKAKPRDYEVAPQKQLISKGTSTPPPMQKGMVRVTTASDLPTNLSKKRKGKLKYYKRNK